MKKMALVLAALMLLTMLGGCYKSDTTMKFGMAGGMEVTSTLLASPDTYSSFGVESPDVILEQFSEESLNAYLEESGNKETGERLELSRIDADGNVVAPGTELSAEGMSGTRLRMKFDSFSDAQNSILLNSYLSNLGTMSLNKDASGNGLDIEEKHTVLGTKYTASGKLSVYGTYAEMMGENTAEMQGKLADASNSVTFRFPLFSIAKSSGADSKGFLGQSMTWTATAGAPDRDIYFEVTVINPLVLDMALIILILVIILIVVLRKKKKNDEPDAYFMDENGNLIPVYDEADLEELEAMDGVAEDVDAVIEEIEEAEADEVPETEDGMEVSAEEEITSNTEDEE
ncbi:MAG: hypothetical protein IJN25_02280 [Clostridia bacterium]|nr:hypothetical protein [Clostridia bacterium]